MAPTNGDDIVYKDGIKHPGLRVLIAGAGIGGLTAAIALRNQGHVVHVFEQSSVLRASPYAIHLAPNGVGLLRKLGVDIEGMGAVTMDGIRFFREDGHMFSSEDRKATAYRWQNQWLLGPRENLNQQLVYLATSDDGLGQPVTIHTDSKVISVDADTGSLTLSGGQVFTGDVVIGADGVHSNTREAIQRLTPYRSRHNCFRMLLDRKKLSGQPNTHIPKDNTMDMIYSEHTKMVVYPTLRNTKYNCVVTHPTEFTLHFSGDPKAKMMKLCAQHHESFRNMLSTAEDAKFRIWPLYDMDPPTSFIKNRFAILGDAAHPFTPHLAQGAMMAIEDATSLGIMLPRGVELDEIPERLQLYNQARHERSLHIQKLSLIVGGDHVAAEDGAQKGQPLNVQKSLDMALSHDENHASAQILREWLWSKDPQHWLSPTTFGPAFPLGTNSVSAIHTAVPFTSGEFTARIRYRTSATLLRSLLPRQVSFVATDSTAEMTVQLQTSAPTTRTSTNLRYSLRFYVHGITYAASDSTDSGTPACCCILSIESCPDLLTYSREILGLPSRSSDIQCGLDDGSLSISVTSEGICWAKLVLPDICATEGDKYCASRETSSNIGESLVIHKFIPATGRVRRHSTPPQKEENQLPDADYLVIYPPKALWPQNSTSGAVKTRCSRLNARLEISPETADRLPALSGIISRLRELPLLEVLDVVVSTGCDRMTWDWNEGSVVSSVRQDSA